MRRRRVRWWGLPAAALFLYGLVDSLAPTDGGCCVSPDVTVQSGTNRGKVGDKGGSPAQIVLGGVVRAYQRYISSQDIPACKFDPSCSHFCVEAMRSAGLWKGALLAVDRVQRCHALARNAGRRESPSGLIHDPVDKYLYRSGPGTREGAGFFPEIDTAHPGVRDELDLGGARSLPSPDSLSRSPRFSDHPVRFLGFADHLYKEMDYLRAAGEYQRYLYFGGRSREAVLFKLGECYKRGGDHRNALRSFGAIVCEYPEGPYCGPALFEIGHIHFIRDDCLSSASSLLAGRGNLLSAADRYRTGVLLSLDYLCLGRYDAAAEVLRSLDSRSPGEKEKRLIGEFSRFAQEGKELPSKSPLLSALLSAVVPGAGKVYCGKYADGINVLALTGFTAWALVNTINRNEEHWTCGEVLLGAGTGMFYLGNIYGSYVAADIYRDEKEEELQGEIRMVFHRDFSF
ncbi:MAG: membrane protein insertion efficiency factor YidD [Candidatus Krumholzibacteriota bacterium]|nr:membrane protein insertion efficiency factor YidD [Candidatus Krumholzibacteriota bacterium]